MSKGFLRWMFKDAHKNPCNWGGVIAIIGGLASLGGCPQPIPFLLVTGGWTIIFADCIYVYLRYQKALYELEQNQLVQKLKQDS